MKTFQVMTVWLIGTLCLIGPPLYRSGTTEATLAPRNTEVEQLSRMVDMLHNRTTYLEGQAKNQAQYSQTNRQLLQAQDVKIKEQLRLNVVTVKLWQLHNDPNEEHYDAPVVDPNGAL